MNKKIVPKNINLLFFSIATSIIAYGFTLTNFALTIDSEQTFSSATFMDLGRWGTNLVRFHIFGGITPYFTLLLGLLLLSLTAVELTKLFKLNGVMSYAFCGLFLTFPQLSYQLIFTLQADAIPLGFLLSVVATSLFIESTVKIFSIKSIIYFMISALILMFVISIYQALIFIPIAIYLIHFFITTFKKEFYFKAAFVNAIYFGVLIITSAILYFISIKILCPPSLNGGYLSSYTSGKSNDLLIDFYNLWIDNIRGDMYYGDKIFFLATLAAVLLLIKFAFDKTLFIIRSVTLFLILLVPFIISVFITNGANPPRLYVSSGIVFAFLIVFLLSYIKKYEKLTALICSVICLINIYFITLLFQSSYKIFNHDKEIAKKIDSEIYSIYPEFNSNVNYVYFYGCLPYGEYDRFRIPNSEIFGGTFFLWDNGSNNRIINFIKFNDIAYYKEIDNKDIYLKIKDSIKTMPIWPKKGFIRVIDNVVIVKLGKEKGTKLAVE